MMLRRRHPEDGEGAVRPGEPGIDEALGPEMTVVGRDAQLEGTLVSAESIRIDGKAKGKIAAAGDVILSSHGQVEGHIRAKNVVMGGTLKGDITARTRTEVAQGGRVEGKIRSKVLVVREGALFSGQSTMDLEDAPDEADGSAYQEDELRMAYEEAVRRGAQWYRSRLFGPNAEPEHERGAEPDAPMSEPDAPMSEPDAPMSEPDAPMSEPDAPMSKPDNTDARSGPSPSTGPERINGLRAGASIYAE